MSGYYGVLAATSLILKKRRKKHQKWKDRLTAAGKLRRDYWFPRSSIKGYNESPFKYLFDNSNDQALLNACGVDHEEFLKLLELFGPLFDEHMFDEKTGEVYRKKQTGRPGSIDAVRALGMVLMWYQTKGPLNPGFPLFSYR